MSGSILWLASEESSEGESEAEAVGRLDCSCLIRGAGMMPSTMLQSVKVEWVAIWRILVGLTYGQSRDQTVKRGYGLLRP